MNTPPTLETLYAPVQDALDAVREEIARVWSDALRLVRLSDTGLTPPGGKLLRPALCLLSAGALSAADLRRYAPMAAAFEALHIASLTHDDVIDRALMRRGARSLNALWNNHAAVLGGDYLVARAIEMLALYDSCPVIVNAITSVRRMAEGELYFFGRENAPITPEDCLALAEQKTASLFAEACAAPSFIFDRKHHDDLHAFGIALGIAFQIIDDLIDLTQPAERLGKPACGDISEGKRTLPLFYLREELDETDEARLDAMQARELTTEEQTWVAQAMTSSGASEKTLAMARRYTDRAQDHLNALPQSPYTHSMSGLTEFILVRVS